VRFVVADAYTYGNVPDRSVRSQKHPFELAGGLNTPRVHAILPARISLSVISWRTDLLGKARYVWQQHGD